VPPRAKFPGKATGESFHNVTLRRSGY